MLSLSDAARRQIEDKVAAAENRTAALFAVVVTPASDDYAAYPMLWAALIALVAGNLVALAWPALATWWEYATWWIVALQAALFVASYLLLNQKQLRYRLVPPWIKRKHARQLARIEFAALLHERTPGNVGLMLFVTEAERHVEILAHPGVDERVDQGTWERIVGDFVTDRSADRVPEAFDSAISACAAILERHFPATADATPPRITKA